MISLTFGLAGMNNQTGGSFMNLIYAPFYLHPDWSGYIFVGFAGGHSHGAIEDKKDTIYFKIFKFMMELNGQKIEKTFKIKYPLPKLELINMEMRAVKVLMDEN